MGRLRGGRKEPVFVPIAAIVVRSLWRGYDLCLAGIVEQCCQILGSQRLVFDDDSSNSDPHKEEF